MSGREPTIRAGWPAWSCVPLVAALFWAYWPALEQMARRWSQDPQYTHGYVVPVFAAFVLWLRRDAFPGVSSRGAWWGVTLLVLAGCLRMAGAMFSLESINAGSLVPALAGVLMLTLGAPVARWAWPGGVFLLFILPWPFQVDVLLTYPLRRVATLCSTYALQTMGVPALARGNIIVIDDEPPIGVVEACSGLGMLMTFFALSTAVALVIRRPLADRLVLFASAVPIGVLMNVVRITLTVLLIRLVDAATAQVVFHDVAGWVMMPMALGVLWLEMLWLARLRVPGPPKRSRRVAVPPAPPPAQMPGWLSRREGGVDVRKTTRPDETSAEHRAVPADGPPLEIPDVAC
jgi:exosortase